MSGIMSVSFDVILEELCFCRCLFAQCGTHLLEQYSFSWVAAMIGILSFSLTSELPPERPTQSPGAVPFSHAQLRTPKMHPCVVRLPDTLRPRFLARPLQINCAGPLFIRVSLGNSCLHAVAQRYDWHALGICRVPVLAFCLCMWCCAHFMFSWRALLNELWYCSLSRTRHACTSSMPCACLLAL